MSRRALVGINVLGFQTSNSGIGIATAKVIELLSKRGILVCSFDLESRDRGTVNADGSWSPSRIRMEDLIYPVNLIVIPITLVESVLDRFENEALRRSRLNVGLCFWELPTIPVAYAAHLNRLDVIVATSEFMRQVFQLAVSGPAVIAGRLPCDMPEEIEPDRPRFGIPDHAVAFVSSFEPGSDPKRKNPFGVVDAFLRGIGSDERAFLILRVKNATRDGKEHPVMAELRSQIQSHSRIILVAGDLDYVGVLSLYASCDVFVSLHRAEGLGLGMLESMALGKAVIATGWSGNMTFMDHTSACLVRYALVPTEGSIHAYRQENLEDTTVWAEPDVEHAAHWMKILSANVEEREHFSRRARQRYLQFTSDQASGDFIAELAEIVQQKAATPQLRSQEFHQVTQGLRLDRIARIKQLEGELRWIQSRRIFRLGRMVKRLFQIRSASNP